MKVALYVEKDKLPLLGEVYASLLFDGIDVVPNLECLCEKSDVKGLDAVIVHPHYDNDNGCWSKISDVIDSNKNTKFFLMVMAASERELFFGSRPNLIYINHTNQSDFFKDAAKYIKTHIS